MLDSNGKPKSALRQRTIRLDGYYFLAKKCDGPTLAKNLVISYPSNNAPVVQDLGKKEMHYSIVLELGGKGKTEESNKSNLDFQKSLILKLYEKQSFIFIEPTGKRYSSKISTISTENMVNGVIYTIDLIVFYEIKEKKKGITNKLIKAKSKSIFKKFNDWLTNKLKQPAWWKNLKNTVNSTITNFRSTVNTLNNISDSIVNEFNRPNQWLQQFNQTMNDIKKICQTPTKIFQTINNLCNNLIGTFNNIKDFANTAFKQDFNWKTSGSSTKAGDLPISVTSIPALSTNAEEVQKQLASDIIETSVKLSLLTSFTDFSVDYGFTTSEDIDLFIESFDTMFNDLMANEFLDFDVKKEMIEYKQYIYDFINNIDVKNIIDVVIVSPSTLINIVYNYYGNLDYFEDILKLNNFTILDIFNITGTIKMFEV